MKICVSEPRASTNGKALLVCCCRFSPSAGKNGNLQTDMPFFQTVHFPHSAPCVCVCVFSTLTVFTQKNCWFTWHSRPPTGKIHWWGSRMVISLFWKIVVFFASFKLPQTVFWMNYRFWVAKHEALSPVRWENGCWQDWSLVKLIFR